MAHPSATSCVYSAILLSRAPAVVERECFASLKLLMRSLDGGNGNSRKFCCMSSDAALLRTTLFQPVLHEFLSPFQAAQTWRIAYEGRIVTILHCPFRAPDMTGRQIASLCLPSSQLQTSLLLWSLRNILLKFHIKCPDSWLSINVACSVKADCGWKFKHYRKGCPLYWQWQRPKKKKKRQQV